MGPRVETETKCCACVVKMGLPSTLADNREEAQVATPRLLPLRPTQRHRSGLHTLARASACCPAGNLQAKAQWQTLLCRQKQPPAVCKLVSAVCLATHHQARAQHRRRVRIKGEREMNQLTSKLVKDIIEESGVLQPKCWYCSGEVGVSPSSAWGMRCSNCTNFLHATCYVQKNPKCNNDETQSRCCRSK